GRDGRVRARARRRHARRRHAVRAGGLRRGGLANRRSAGEGRHARLRIRAGQLGTEGSRLETFAPWRLAESEGDIVVRIKALVDADLVAQACAAFTLGAPRAAVAAWG